jgi:hypothetical protein
MAAVSKVCRITMDTALEPCMIVHRKGSTLLKFRQYTSGLYYYDAAPDSLNRNQNSTVSDAYIFFNTVAANKQRFTAHEIAAANQARSLYPKLSGPSQSTFCALLDENQILNCPVTSDYAKRALLIYGPDVVTLKGKTTKRQNRAAPNFQPVAIPAPIIAQYRSPRMFIDIFLSTGAHTTTP